MLVGKNYLSTDTTFELSINSVNGDSLTERLIPYGKSINNNFCKFDNTYSFVKDTLLFATNIECPPPPNINAYQKIMASPYFYNYENINLPYGCHVCGNYASNVNQYYQPVTLDDSTIIFQNNKYAAHTCWGSNYDIEYYNQSSTRVLMSRHNFSYHYGSSSLSWTSGWQDLDAGNAVPGNIKYFKNIKKLISFSDNDTFSTNPLNDFCLRVYEPFYKNIITGAIYVDANGNHIKDSNEPIFTAAIAKTYDSLGSDISNASFSNNATYNGTFNNEVKNGKFVTKLQSNKKYYTSYPTSYTSIFLGDGGRDTVNFGLTPIPNKTDMQVNVFALTAARPGFLMQYILTYKNQGTTITSGTIKFIKDSKQSIINTTPVYTSQIGDTLFWDYNNMGLDSSASITIDLVNGISPSLNNGDVVSVKASISSTATDETPFDNEASVSTLVRGSFDPNEKLEVHNGVFTLTELAANKSLLYTINFQNTGTDTAFNVKIIDTISNKLDLSTFEIVNASNKYKLNIINNKYIEVLFNNILLVDSNRNAANSHGYFSYRIKPKQNVVHNDTIKNAASIYFDYNLPVITNINNTVVINTTLPVKLKSFTGLLNSNKLVALNWQMATEDDVARYVVEKSVDAQNFDALKTVVANKKDIYQILDEYPVKGVNYYRLKIEENTSKYTYSNIVVIKLNEKSSISIFPNPATNQLTINRSVAVNSNNNETIAVFDIMGKRITTLQLTSLQQIFDISKWSKGIYILSFENGEKVKLVKE